MATTTMVHIRLEESVKAEATEALAAMGLTVSDAVRVFLMRVIADKQMPFELRVPNVETRAAMQASRALMAARSARNPRFASADALIDDLEKNVRK